MSGKVKGSLLHGLCLFNGVPCVLATGGDAEVGCMVGATAVRAEEALARLGSG